MGKEQNPKKIDTDLETLLARRAELQAELTTVEKQISDLQNQGKKPSAPVEQTVKETQQAVEKQKRIATLKNNIEFNKSQIEFYKGEKAKQEHHLRRGLADEDFTQNSDTARYLKDRIENADQMIAIHSANLEKLEK